MIVLTRYATSMNHMSQTWLSGREIHGKRQGRIRWQNHRWEPMFQDIRPKRQPTNQPASQPTNQPNIGLWTGQNFWLASLDMLFAWNQSFFKSEPPQKFHSVMFDQRLSQNGRLRHWSKIVVSPYHWHHQLDWVSGTAASPSSSLKKVSPMT
jgi:hypothetical protein